MERRDVIIIGGGPAGAATALYLARRDPALARRTLILEKARHPRVKVCAGGLIPHALGCLDELGIGLSVPHVMVDRARVDVPGRRVEMDGHRFAAVIRRAEFDAALLAAARDKGVEVREEQKVQALTRGGAGLIVETVGAGAIVETAAQPAPRAQPSRATYTAPIVVGADGSGSVVRRSLFAADGTRAAIGRAVMADIPIADGCRWDGHARARYDFDFRAVPAGLEGYAWAFPCLIDGRPHVNAGVYSRRAAGSGAALTALLAALEIELGGARVRHQSAPIRGVGRTPFAAANVLLVGDAAGVEPLMGEGISFAFEYGRWAAEEIAHALERDDFAMAGAETRFRRSWVGRKLRRLDQAATMFYGPGARLWLGARGTLARRPRGRALLVQRRRRLGPPQRMGSAARGVLAVGCCQSRAQGAINRRSLAVNLSRRIP